MNETQRQFVEMLMPAAMEASQRTGVDPRIIIAQAAQETGWGRSAPNNNYFGIKSHGQGGGSTLMTHEYVNGQRVDMPQSFRGYASPEDSVRGYADFITSNPRYQPFMAASGDLDRQLAELQASGYATDPGYSQSVGSIARSIPITGAPPVRTASAAINTMAPQAPPPARPTGFGFAPVPPQRGVGFAQPQAAQQPAPRGIGMVPQFTQTPDARRNVAVRRTDGVGGFVNNPFGRQADERNSRSNSGDARSIRMANSAAIREATGSGAITRQSIDEALRRGANLVSRA